MTELMAGAISIAVLVPGDWWDETKKRARAIALWLWNSG